VVLVLGRVTQVIYPDTLEALAVAVVLFLGVSPLEELELLIRVTLVVLIPL
jgi:hypothetical protein